LKVVRLEVRKTVNHYLHFWTVHIM